ncbi:MAG: cyclase family protein [Rhodothermia bacterium]|nr:cyclase family protein [Rhodothermia bacterium]
MLIAAAALIAAGCQRTEIDLDRTLGSAQFVDLTHTFDSTSVYWPTEEGFVLEPGFAGYTDKGFYYSANTFRAAEHGGTHLDAPVHFADGKQTADEIPLANLIGPAAVVDVAAQVAANPDYQISRDDMLRWESDHGPLPDGAILLFNTGYSEFWPDRSRYMGTADRGAEAVAQLHFPGLDPSAATWLVANRHIHAVGIDTPSIDYGQSTHFEAHQTLFEANIPAFENIANPGALPPTGAWVFALPMKIAGGSGGPLRIVGVVPKAD